MHMHSADQNYSSRLSTSPQTLFICAHVCTTILYLTWTNMSRNFLQESKRTARGKSLQDVQNATPGLIFINFTFGTNHDIRSLNTTPTLLSKIEMPLSAPKAVLQNSFAPDTVTHEMMSRTFIFPHLIRQTQNFEANLSHLPVNETLI